MKFYEFDLDGETIKLRLTSNDCVEIEKKTGQKLIDYMQDYAMNTILTLLMYMRRSSVPNFSMKDAGELYDKLIDNEEYGCMENILYNVIFEGLVVSGFLKKEELQELKKKLMSEGTPQVTQK